MTRPAPAAEAPQSMAASVRPAAPADLPEIQRIVTAAFTPYIPRLGRPPAVMGNDYAALIAAGAVFVLAAGEGASQADPGEALAGLIVLSDEPEVLYVDTLAVDPGAHGQGLGRALLDFAAAEARRRDYPAVRLCTNLVMTENLGFYRHLGWEETHRGVQAGFERVFYRKPV